jgi:hypothetical protein
MLLLNIPVPEPGTQGKNVWSSRRHLNQPEECVMLNTALPKMLARRLGRCLKAVCVLVVLEEKTKTQER